MKSCSQESQLDSGGYIYIYIWKRGINIYIKKKKRLSIWEFEGLGEVGGRIPEGSWGRKRKVKKWYNSVLIKMYLKNNNNKETLELNFHHTGIKLHHI